MLCPRGEGGKGCCTHTHTSLKLLGLGGGQRMLPPTAKSIGILPRSPFSPRLSTTWCTSAKNPLEPYCYILFQVHVFTSHSVFYVKGDGHPPTCTWKLKVLGRIDLNKQCRSRSVCSFRSILIRASTVCHSICIFWAHNCIVQPNCSILRLLLCSHSPDMDTFRWGSSILRTKR